MLPLRPSAATSGLDLLFALSPSILRRRPDGGAARVDMKATTAMSLSSPRKHGGREGAEGKCAGKPSFFYFPPLTIPVLNSLSLFSFVNKAVASVNSVDQELKWAVRKLYLTVDKTP